MSYKLIPNMTLQDLGYNDELENYRRENDLISFDVGKSNFGA